MRKTALIICLGVGLTVVTFVQPIHAEDKSSRATEATLALMSLEDRDVAMSAHLAERMSLARGLQAIAADVGRTALDRREAWSMLRHVPARSAIRFCMEEILTEFSDLNLGPVSDGGQVEDVERPAKQVMMSDPWRGLGAIVEFVDSERIFRPGQVAALAEILSKGVGADVALAVLDARGRRGQPVKSGTSALRRELELLQKR